MAQEIYQTVVGNNQPDLTITCQRDSTAINLSSVTSVLFIITNERTGSVTNSSAQACTITTAASGIVTYSPAATDFPSYGRYIGEIKITYTSGKVERLKERLLIIAHAATN